jgi:micrococcal nuclease
VDSVLGHRHFFYTAIDRRSSQTASLSALVVYSALAMTFLLLLLLTQSVELQGRVVGVHDGDTVTVLVDKTSVKVRLAEVDAPELKQDFGMVAKKVLSELVFDKNVQIDVLTKDRYGRSVGRIWLGEKDVNFLLVSKGAAWCYRQYLKRKECLPLEEKAKAEKIGLWVQAEPTPPWEWRKKKKVAEAKP